MNNYILYCPNCHKMYKCINRRPSVKGPEYITDFGDVLSDKCVCCKQKVNFEVSETVDWIADLVFTVKGELN